MWCCLTPAPRVLFLISAKLPISAPLADDRVRPEVAERPDRGVVADLGALDHAGPDAAARADGGVVDLAAAGDGRALAHRRPAAQDDVGLEDDVLGQLDGVVEVDRRRVVHRHAGQHPALVELDPHVPLGPRELRAVVDAQQAAVVLDLERGDDPAVGAGGRDEVREVQLAGGRRRAGGRAIAGAASAASKAYRPALISLIAQLLVVGVLLLDDPLDAAGLVADDAARGPPGSMASTAVIASAAWSRRRSASSSRRSSARRSGTSPLRTRISVDVVGDLLAARRGGRRRCRGARPGARSRPCRRTRRGWRRSRASDDDRAACRGRARAASTT